MMLVSENWILAIILSIILIVALVLLNRYYAKYSHSHINDGKDLAKHPDKYRLYFLVTGIFFPTSEAMIEAFKAREESELLHYLIVGVFCVSIAIISKYVNKVRHNLHKIFVLFFCTLSLLLFYNIYSAPAHSINLIEFTMFVILAYYAFFNIKHFYCYILICVIFISVLFFIDVIDGKLFILYTNSCFVSFVFTYGIYVIDANIKENLFFAYNFVNKSHLLVVGIDEKGSVIFVSENIRAILGYSKESWIGTSWQNIIGDAVEMEDSEDVEKTVFLQQFTLNNDKHKLIEWREESFYKDLVIKIGKDVTQSRRAEVELKRAKELLEQTNRIARVGGWEYDFEKQEIAYSDITKELFGVIEASKSSRHKILDYFVEGENRDTLIKAFTKCVKYGVSYDCELQIINDKGQKRWIRTKGTSEFVNNRTKRVYGIIQDIDEQVKAKMALKDSEERFRFIAENTSDVILSFNAGKVNYLSPVHERLFGYTTEEAIKIAEGNIYDFVHPDDKEMVRNMTKQAIQKKSTSVTYTFRFLLKNGDYMWREDTVDMIYGDNGFPLKAILLARDVSQRKITEIENQQRQEKQLLQNNILIRLSMTPFDEHSSWEKELRTIVEAAAEGNAVSRVSIWSYTKNMIVCDDLYDDSTKQHSSGEKLTEIDFPLYFSGIKNGLSIVANDALTHEYTCEFTEKYLKPLAIKSMLDVPIRVGGELVGIVCWEQTKTKKEWTDDDVAFARSIADIVSLRIEANKRKKAEIKLKRANEILEQTSVVAHIGGWEIDVDSQELYFSEINNIIIEAPPSFRLDIKTAFSFYKEGESRDTMYDSMMQCYHEGVPFDIEVQIVTLKGNERWVRAIGQAEFYANKCKRIFGTFQDIDEQVRLIQIIKDKENQYHTLISHISSVTFRCVSNAHWTMVFMSDAIERLTGYPASDFINDAKRSYLSIIHPDDKVNLDTVFNDTISKGEEYSIEYRLLDINNKVIWVLEKGQGYIEENGSRFFQDGTITDITERKEAEIALKQSYEALKITQIELNAVQIEQEKFVSLIKYSDTFIAMVGMDGKVLFLNEKAKIMSGYGESYQNTVAADYHSKAGFELLTKTIMPEVIKNGMWRGEHDIMNSKTKQLYFTDSTMFVIKDPITKTPIALATIQIDITDRKNTEARLIENQTQLFYKSEILAAIVHVTEKLWVSTDIEKTLNESFAEIGKAANADRLYYFENNLKTNIINQKVEWVRESIMPQIANPVTLNLTHDNIYFYVEPLRQNKVFQKTISDITDPIVKIRWQKQGILSVLLIPVLIKNNFYGFIGIDDCTQEQIWSDDKLNLLRSLATNIANALERINNESIIKESEANFRQINETIEDVFLLYDVVQKRYIYISPSCKKVFGEDQTFFYSGESYFKKYLVEDAQQTSDTIKAQLLKNGTSEIEYSIKNEKGQIRWIQEKTFAIYNDKGEFIRFSGICSDITEQKIIQNEIKQLSLVAEKTTNGVLISDAEGYVIWANQAMLQMMEATPQQLFGNRPRDLFSTGSKEFTEKTNTNGKYNFTLELEILTYKKNKKWIQINNSVVKDDEENVLQQIEVIIDITERKKAEKKLKDSERKLGIILNALDEIVWAVSLPDYKLLFVSQSFEKIYGRTTKELAANLNIWREVVYHDDKEIANNAWQEVIKNSMSYTKYRIIDGKGNIKWIENDVKVVRNENDEPLMIMGITTDITDKKIAEQALIKANKEAEVANKSKAELELRALQMQMNPHFVFNALNSIQSYVMSHDTLTANTYLTKFAQLIRLFLDSSRSKFISLSEEIRLLTLYIELEKLRFDDKFDFEIMIDASVSKYFELPTMILQPFIENAINHGLRYKQQKGLLSIKFLMESNYVICKIEDNGVGRKNVGQIQAKSSKGYQSQGLKITAERLMAYNKINEANIVFSVNDKILNPKNANDEVGTVIEIRFPENI